MVVASNDVLYKDLQAENKSAMADVRKNVKGADIYKKILEETQRDRSNKEVSEQKKKRQKLSKSMKEYTHKQGDERLFKGWSSRAATKLNDVMDDLEKEREGNKMFYAAYIMIETKRRKVEKRIKNL